MNRRLTYRIIFVSILLLMIVITVFGQSSQQVPLIVEVTGPVGKTLQSEKLIKIVRNHHIPSSEVYQWENHLVIYDAPHLPALEKEIAAVYQGSTIREYTNPFYHFDRKQHCKDATVAKAWTNIILTANLVKDPKLQQDYLNYHATQFKKWPQVSQGFCNADFQQLLVYKSGRQLMLVISIPKGKTLDELNPKTTENNPRVDQWNAIMKKYQEGLPGTKPGEVWVFLQPVKTR